MKFYILIFLFSSHLFSQNRIKIKNEITLEHIPFVNVYNDNILVGKTNINGEIVISDTIKNLELVHPDFVTSNVKIDKASVFSLKPTAQILDELVIFKPRNTFFKKLINKGEKITTFPISSIECIKRIIPLKKEIGKRLFSISIDCYYNDLFDKNLKRKENDEIIYSYRLTIYKANNKIIFSDFLNVSVKEAKVLKELRFEIDKDIQLTSNGIYVGFEYLGRLDTNSNFYLDNISNLFLKYNLEEKSSFYVSKFKNETKWKTFNEVDLFYFQDLFTNLPPTTVKEEVLSYVPIMKIELY